MSSAASSSEELLPSSPSFSGTFFLPAGFFFAACRLASAFAKIVLADLSLSSGPPCALALRVLRLMSSLRTKVSHMAVVQYRCGQAAHSMPTRSMKFTGNLLCSLPTTAPDHSSKKTNEGLQKARSPELLKSQMTLSN